MFSEVLKSSGFQLVPSQSFAVMKAQDILFQLKFTIQKVWGERHTTFLIVELNFRQKEAKIPTARGTAVNQKLVLHPCHVMVMFEDYVKYFKSLALTVLEIDFAFCGEKTAASRPS
ncbi:hypothetical protein M8J77_005568 [Diaphorina citri]|nr:hypothetical protein M8J77_005568 [Diaphorina citri]